MVATIQKKSIVVTLYIDKIGTAVIFSEELYLGYGPLHSAAWCHKNC